MTPFEIIEHRRRFRSLVDKYSRSFPTFSREQSRMKRENPAVAATVLLSGSTGAFGANILAELVASPTIRRAAKAILDSPRVRLIEADLSIEGFGVGKDLYEELDRSIMHVILNGWKVNFNAPLSPNSNQTFGAVGTWWIFVSRHVHEMIGLQKSYLVSEKIPMTTVDADSLDPDRPLPEEYLDQPDCTLGMGYAEAKWVSGNILMKRLAKLLCVPQLFA
ncbi:hypothetical protein ACEPAF_3035 [Sanghuangporus sanghuang]